MDMMMFSRALLSGCRRLDGESQNEHSTALGSH
jgi:hypothetical protein